VLYRLLQKKLDKPYPIHQLKEALNSAMAVKLEKGIYVLTDTTEAFTEIEKSSNVNLQYKRIKTEVLKASLNQVRKN
jgi:hypothetical protein